ncbi:MAG: fumarate/nitrate reduction transcriptional regulator Fnr [Piscirickettsiaceae bacterium]|nr:fumarate/nitrate reduction transcriptional regulator Fnr [Piscirickettsiaceae bacterium]
MAQLDNVTPLFKDLAKIEHDQNVACHDCSLYRLCLPLGLHNSDLVKLDTIIKRSNNYKRNQPLFSADKQFLSLFVVRSGSFKTTITANDGREQVTGFYFPGEFIGLDAIHQNVYQSNAEALETSSVCELPYEQMQEFGKEMPQLQIQMLTRLSKELSNDKGLMLLLGKKTADEKLASFLLSLSKRFQVRGFSATNFHLSMSRGDIANHLGLAVETVSRLFSRFQDDQLINIAGKSISLRDMEKLEVLCGE